MGSKWCLRKFFRFLKLILMARHMFLCQASQCQLGHMSLRRYQPPEPRGREPDTEVRGKGTCSTFVRGESQTLLYWATKICQLGEEFFFFNSHLGQVHFVYSLPCCGVWHQQSRVTCANFSRFLLKSINRLQGKASGSPKALPQEFDLELGRVWGVSLFFRAFF